jgi:glyoxalase family protein
MKLVNGIHHVTALASGPQDNVNFYAGILGLRLVKKTINFDAPDVYHFYYGNEIGAPGTILTFFPYGGLVRGRHGKGQLTVTSFSIPRNSLSYWMERLTKFKIPFQQTQERFGEGFIYLEDHDGLGIELIESDKDPRPGFSYGSIDEKYSIRGFHSITLSEDGYEKTAGLLTTYMDHDKIAEAGNRFRYSASGSIGDIVDIVCEPERMRGLQGAGTVHHVAFSTNDDDTIVQMQQRLLKANANVTQVLDRQYFHSIYFREPGGVLFEIATNPPGFAIDEEQAHLGEALKLPSWQEANRAEIEHGLVPVEVDWKKFR